MTHRAAERALAALQLLGCSSWTLAQAQLAENLGATLGAGSTLIRHQLLDVPVLWGASAGHGGAGQQKQRNPAPSRLSAEDAEFPLS